MVPGRDDAFTGAIPGGRSFALRPIWMKNVGRRPAPGGRRLLARGGEPPKREPKNDVHPRRGQPMGERDTIMNEQPSQTIHVLNQLYAAECRSLLPWLARAGAFVSWASAADVAVLRQMVEEEREHLA